MAANIKRMMIALILIPASTLYFSHIVQSQGMRMSVEERVKVLKDSLKLTDDQATKITKLLEDQREEMTTLMSEHQGDREAMQSAMQNLMKKTDESIKAILTEKQSKKYDTMMKERRERLGRRMRGGGR